jgi:hypothetical protein
MTAYRQQALLCAALLANGPRRPRDIKPLVPDASQILLSNVYGWFDRVSAAFSGRMVWSIRRRNLTEINEATAISNYRGDLIGLGSLYNIRYRGSGYAAGGHSSVSDFLGHAHAQISPRAESYLLAR